MMIQKCKDWTPRAAKQQQEGCWVHHGYSIWCFDAENAYFYAEEDEDVYCWPPKEWVQRYHASGGQVENPWWKLKRQLH